VDSATEILGPLLKGVRLVILPACVTQNAERFAAAVEDAAVTRIFSVASLVRNVFGVLAARRRADPSGRKMLQKVCVLACK
jgi:non-ribosomal peptide synthetase component F